MKFVEISENQKITKLRYERESNRSLYSKDDQRGTLRKRHSNCVHGDNKNPNCEDTRQIAPAGGIVSTQSSRDRKVLYCSQAIERRPG
jgi:hypothetical protein